MHASNLGHDDYLTELKKNLAAIAGTGVINLATSGVRVSADREHLKSAYERAVHSDSDAIWNENNEFGLPSLKRQIRHAYQVKDEREIVLTPGAFGAVRLAFEMLFAGQPEAEVLIESPVYQPIAKLALRLGAKLTLVERTDDFVSNVIKQVTPRTACIFVSNPNNPTCDWLSDGQMTRLANEVTHRNPRAAILVDEVYADLGPTTGQTAVNLHSSILGASSLTKVFDAAEVRCGWLIADKTKFPKLLNDWTQFEGIGSKLLEVAGYFVFQELTRIRAQVARHMANNRELAGTWLSEMRRQGLLVGDIPTCGCVLFLRLPKELTSAQVVDTLWHQHGVLVTAGHFFASNGDNRIRIGIGGPTPQLTEGLRRIQVGLRSLRHN